MSPGTGQTSIEGHVAIVTGAGSGIGRAIARLFANQGAQVAVLDLTESSVVSATEDIINDGGVAFGCVVDVSVDDEVQRTVANVSERLGRIDILVNSAGVSIQVPIGADDFWDVWDRTIAVDLTAHARLIRACLPELRQSAHGRIVNISSTQGLGAIANNAPYIVAKHGVVGLTKALAVELGPSGITVNCVCPGPIETPMTERIDDAAKARYAVSRIPLRRFGLPHEVAQMVLSLVQPCMSYVTGSVITVDGGLACHH